MLKFRIGLIAIALCWAGPANQQKAAHPPAAAGSGMPFFATSPEGTLHLSWIDPVPEGGHALRLSRWNGAAWESPETIAQGNDWFVNWADFPAVSFLPNGAAYAHWLARPANGGKYGYGIRLARRGFDGKWQQSAAINENDQRDYAGFLSFSGNQIAFLAPADPADGHRKTLRVASLDADGKIKQQQMLDADVCSCCQTSIVKTNSGMLVAYRDHLPGEIRDISLVRYSGGQWSNAYPLHRDGWQINACPTEGPSLAVAGNTIGAAWISRAGGISKLNFATSRDDGKSFSQPVQMDDGNPLGRPTLIALDEQSFALVWIERVTQAAEIRVRRITAQQRKSPSLPIQAVPASRAAGLPKIALHRNELFIAWREEAVKAVRLPATSLPQ